MDPEWNMGGQGNLGNALRAELEPFGFAADTWKQFEALAVPNVDWLLRALDALEEQPRVDDDSVRAATVLRDAVIRVAPAEIEARKYVRTTIEHLTKGDNIVEVSVDLDDNAEDLVGGLDDTCRAVMAKHGVAVPKAAAGRT